MINKKQFKGIGILGFGGYLPFWRLKGEVIGRHWQVDKNISQSLGILQKAVANHDEDSLTMALEASLIALKRAKIKPFKLGAVFVGSESHPYSVKTTSSILGETLNVGREYFCADLQFACKAGTTAIQIVASLVNSGLITYGLAVGADKSQARPGDALEYGSSAGAGAIILGKLTNPKSQVSLQATYSFNSDTPDFWRRPQAVWPSHAGRFTGEPGYFYHLKNCLRIFLLRIKKTPHFFDHIILHMPNAKFPLKIAKKFKISQEKIKLGFLVPQIGNPYSASSLLGLISVLEQAKPKQNILLISYGSGAGSDAFWFKTGNNYSTKELKGKSIKEYLANNAEIDYLTYLNNYQYLQK